MEANGAAQYMEIIRKKTEMKQNRRINRTIKAKVKVGKDSV
jgi:hypothetical protein